ncbi:S26 family signal peptidase [bacterium]|nr:S26 family signal peptidase [bacterium]
MSENETKKEEIIISPVPENKNTTNLEEYNTEHIKTKLQEILEFFRDLAIILAVVIVVRTFIAAPFQISGSSMEESYHDGEFILVNKFSYARIDSPSWTDF